MSNGSSPVVVIDNLPLAFLTASRVHGCAADCLQIFRWITPSSSFVRGRSDVLVYLAAFHHEHRPADNRDVFKRVKSTATRSPSNPGAMAPILPFMLSDSAAINVADMMASIGFWPRHL